ncbi:glutaredoxin family protein [Peribacillus acanthi]|uniref:glutaredoxin family protein n=1 Tax=Peribacillus acanthi TaxID=2171554 RepID=UPI000D3E8C18|nr:glutaredoxin family protein [Peribacillus acanthi]
MEKVLVLYTRIQCPLCIKAKSILESVKEKTGTPFVEIDIYSNDELLERFGLMIPVVEWNGEIIQYGQIDGDLIEAYVNL